MRLNIKTLSLCPICYQEIAALIYDKNGSVFMYKKCKIHGYFNFLVEKDIDFYIRNSAHLSNTPREEGALVLNITNRCNMKCTFCFDLKNVVPDMTQNRILEILKQMPNKFETIVLFGGEPTIRDDFLNITKLIKKEFSNFSIETSTNGLKLAHKVFFEEYIRYVDRTGFSLNLKKDNTNIHYRKKLQALENFRTTNHKVGNITYTIDGLEQLEDALLDIEKHCDICSHFKIRNATNVGNTKSVISNHTLSDLIEHTKKILKKYGKVSTQSVSYNLYWTDIFYEQKTIRLFAWPTINSIDLGEIRGGPHYLTMNDRVVNAMEGFFIDYAIKKNHGIT